MDRRFWHWVPGLSLVVLGLMGLVGCERSTKQAGPPPRPPARVGVTEAVARTVPVYLDAIGRVIPTESVSILPQVGGMVVAAHVEDGAWVRKGDLLFEIDRRPFEAALASAQATLQQAQATNALAKTEYQRVSNLPKGATSQQEVELRKNAVDVSEAQIAAALAAVETAKLNLEYTKIYAPMDGRAGARLVDPGNVVKANDAPMLEIQAVKTVLAEFTITENDLGTVRKYLSQRGMDLASTTQNLRVEVDVPGNSARVLGMLGSMPTMSAAATRPAQVKTTRTGKLVFLDNSVQANTGTIRLRAQMQNEDSYFWPGQFVNVRLVLVDKPEAVLIPAQAQQIGQQGPFVYVVKADNTVELRPIVPGQLQGEMLVVDKGVEAGERIIVTGQFSVIPGSPVQMAGATPTTAPAGAAAAPVPATQKASTAGRKSETGT